jgi:hypothetical protein
MRSAGTHSLADIGDWPRIEIGSHSVIRHAYENVLTACARLASFSTGGPTTTDGPISGQQEILAVDAAKQHALALQQEDRDEQQRHRRRGRKMRLGWPLNKAQTFVVITWKPAGRARIAGTPNCPPVPLR